MSELTKRQKLDYIHAQLANERMSFESHFRDISDFVLPRRSRWYTEDANRGDRRNQKIIDSTATLASRDLAAMLMAGDTSPARKWFDLTVPDAQLAEVPAVKLWCYDVGEILRWVFLKSNLYSTLPIVYEDSANFATAVMLVEEDYEDVVHFREFPVGSYWIGQDPKYRVNTFIRDYRMTVRQIVDEFARDPADNSIDWSRVSTTVKNYWDRDLYEQWIDVRHVIAPNPEYAPNRVSPKYKRFMSSYYEKGTYASDLEATKFLRESGYDYCPIICHRWDLSGEDIYGTNSPGMTALGDIKALQLLHKRKAQAIEKQVNPPLNAPASLKTRKVTQIAGDVNYYDQMTGQGVAPLMQVNPDVKAALLDIQEHQRRIKECYYVHLIMSLLNPALTKDMTAREVEERSQEKYYVLGRLMERTKRDLKDPLIEIAFQMALRQGMIPPPPEELQGMPLKVEYVSVMAQAAKSVALAGQDRFMAFVGNLLVISKDMSVVDKVDLDQAIDEYGVASGIPPRIIRSDEQVAQMRAARAKLQAQAAMMEQLQQGAKAAKDLAGADMEKDSALSRISEAASSGALPLDGEQE